MGDRMELGYSHITLTLTLHLLSLEDNYIDSHIILEMEFYTNQDIFCLNFGIH